MPAEVKALIAVVIGFVLCIASNQILTVVNIRQNDRQWCQTLVLLTRHPIPRPADPKANPSREANYEVYTALYQLKVRFHC